MLIRIKHSPTPWLLAIFLLGLVWTSPGQESIDKQDTNPLSERMAEEAEAILKNLKSTTYQHKTEIRPDIGSYKLDCSGLVVHITKIISPDHLKCIPIEEGKPRARAFAFYDVFNDIAHGDTTYPGWSAVPKLADARRGDVIVWRKPNLVAGQNSGHVMIIAESPIEEPDHSFRMVVYDSTTILHDNDSRKSGTTGVGKGTMWFKANADGTPSEYRRNSHSKFHSDPIAIGRMTKILNPK